MARKLITLDFRGITQEGLNTLNAKKATNCYGMIFGTTEAEGATRKYKIYVEYEGKDFASREGIALYVFEAAEDGSQKWVTTIRDIVSATNLQRFLSRSRNLICDAINIWELKTEMTAIKEKQSA